MTEAGPAVHDWNAADADKGQKKPSLLNRLGLASHRSMTRRALRDAGAVRLSDGDHPRFRNIAEGLAGRLGLGRVDLFVIPEGGPNALAGRTEGPVIAATASLLGSYSRTELEAVVAHCFVRHRDAGRKGVRVGYSDDVRAVALTRYPPALAGAIEKAEPHRGRFGAFYLVATSPSHRDPAERIRALNDL